MKKTSLKGQGINIFLPQTQPNTQQNSQTQKNEVAQNITRTIPQTYRILPEVLEEFNTMYKQLKHTQPFVSKTQLVNVALKNLIEKFKKEGTLEL